MRVPHDQGSEGAGVGTNERNKRVELLSTTAARPVVDSGGGGDAGNNGGDAGDGNDGDNDRGHRGCRQRAKLSVTTSPHQRFGDRSDGDSDGDGDRRGRRLLQTRDLLRRYSIVDRTLDRWLADPRLNFPKPMIVNRRRYWSESEVDAFDAQQKLATARALRAKAETKIDAAQKAEARGEITGKKPKGNLDEAVGAIPPAAYSIKAFCIAHNISEAFFFKLKKEGRGPREMAVGRRTLISIEAAADWRHEREADAATEAA